MEQYIQPFITVTQNVFKDFVGHEIKAGFPFFTGKQGEEDWEVSGIIGLSGEARGAVALSLKTDYALIVTDTLTGKKHEGIDEEVVDAVGEIINIIAGNAKQKLEDMFNLVISLPSIVKGKGHSIVWSKEHARIMCIPFTVLDKYTFHLSVAIAASGGST
jgi:chemotaxis protein CheX